MHRSSTARTTRRLATSCFTSFDKCRSTCCAFKAARCSSRLLCCNCLLCHVLGCMNCDLVSPAFPSDCDLEHVSGKCMNTLGVVFVLFAVQFDAADRMFNSVAETWAGVTSTSSDLKELTPEFYSGDGDFLVNHASLDLGVRANGRRVRYRYHFLAHRFRDLKRHCVLCFRALVVARWETLSCRHGPPMPTILCTRIVRRWKVSTCRSDCTSGSTSSLGSSSEERYVWRR